VVQQSESVLKTCSNKIHSYRHYEHSVKKRTFTGYAGRLALTAILQLNIAAHRERHSIYQNVQSFIKSNNGIQEL